MADGHANLDRAAKIPTSLAERIFMRFPYFMLVCSIAGVVAALVWAPWWYAIIFVLTGVTNLMQIGQVRRMDW